MAAFEFTSFFPLPSVFCSEHLPLHDASPRHSDPGQHENNRRSGLRAGGSERVCQEEQQRKWLRYTFSEDVVCLERLLPGEGTLVQIIVFDGTKYIVKEGKGLAEFDLIAEKEALAKWTLPCLFRSHYIKGDFLLPVLSQEEEEGRLPFQTPPFQCGCPQ